MLTNREIASLILIAALVVFVVVRPEIRKSVSATFRILFSHQIMTINMIYLVYAAAVVYLAYRLGIWNLELLKDTVLLLLVVGYPMVFRANAVTDGVVLFHRTFRETFAVSVFVVFYLNLSSLPVIWELILQIVGIFAAVVAVVANSQGSKARSVAIFMNVVLIAISIVYLITTTVSLASNWKVQNLELVLRTLAMTIWLPILLLPLIYVGAFLMQVQVLLVMLPFNNGRKKVMFPVSAALVVGLRGSVRLATGFIGKWRRDIAETTSYTDARMIMVSYRNEARERRRNGSH